MRWQHPSTRCKYPTMVGASCRLWNKNTNCVARLKWETGCIITYVETIGSMQQIECIRPLRSDASAHSLQAAAAIDMVLDGEEEKKPKCMATVKAASFRKQLWRLRFSASGGVVLCTCVLRAQILHYLFVTQVSSQTIASDDVY